MKNKIMLFSILLLANFQLVSGSYGFDYGAGSGLWNSFLGGVKSAWDGLTYPVREHPGWFAGATVVGLGGYGVYRGYKNLDEKYKAMNEKLEQQKDDLQRHKSGVAISNRSVENSLRFQDQRIGALNTAIQEEGTKTRDFFDGRMVDLQNRFDAQGAHLKEQVKGVQGVVNELRDQGEVVNGRLTDLESQGIRLEGQVEGVQRSVNEVKQQGNEVKGQLDGISRSTNFMVDFIRQNSSSSQRPIADVPVALEHHSLPNLSSDSSSSSIIALPEVAKSTSSTFQSFGSSRPSHGVGIGGQTWSQSDIEALWDSHNTKHSLSPLKKR